MRALVERARLIQLMTAEASFLFHLRKEGIKGCFFVIYGSPNIYYKNILID
jgi:hypothetical protein